MRTAKFAAIAMVSVATGTVVPLSAQAPTRTLTRPEAEFAEPFSLLRGVRELRDGRVIVSDMTEKKISLLDFAKGSVMNIGSEGQGPGEFMLPGAVVAVPGDTTLVGDALGKFLKIAPNGTVVGDVTPPSASVSMGGGGRMMIRGSGGTVADGMGRLYSAGSAFMPGPDGRMAQADSAPIVRYDPRSGKSDTITYIAVPKAEVQTANRGGGTSFTVRAGGGSVPFVVQPSWAVAPDGRIAIVTPEPYRVTWVSPTGEKTVGAPITYERVRVSEAEKEAYRERFKSSPPTGMSISMGSRGTSVGQTSVPFTEPDRWPEFKHPYNAGQGSVIVAPNGELWLQKQLPFTQKNPTFDVVGARGEVTGRVVLPQSTSLLGFGANGAVYLIRRDEDDLQYLQRHRLTSGR